MLVKTSGVVLKTIKYSNTSLISTIFTKEHGILTFMLKGALRSIKKGKGNILQPGYILDMEIHHKENRNFQFLKEYKLETIYQSIDFHFKKKSIALFLVEFSQNILDANEVNEELFDLLVENLLHLDKPNHIGDNIAIDYMKSCASLLGFGFTEDIQPGNYFDLLHGSFDTLKKNRHTLELEESQLIYNFATNDEFRLTSTQRKALFEIYLEYFELHIPEFRKMKSPEVMREVFR